MLMKEWPHWHLEHLEACSRSGCALHCQISIDVSQLLHDLNHPQSHEKDQTINGCLFPNTCHQPKERKMYIPVLQLVMIESSVNVNQHSGSGSMLLDYVWLISAKHGWTFSLVDSMIATHQDRRQHGSPCSWLHRMLDSRLVVRL